MTNIQKISQSKIVNFVPDENIINESESLCIRGNNLKCLGGEIVCANLNRLPKYFTWIAEDTISWICV